MSHLGAVAPTPPDRDGSFELLWTAPAECPDRDAARVEIERHLGRAIGDELGRGVRVTVAIDRDADLAWRTMIAFDGPQGRTTRELVVATECARTVDAAALVIAIAIDPSLALVPPPDPEPGPDPEPEPAPPPEPAPDPAPPEGEPPGRQARGVAPPPPVASRSGRPIPIRGAIGLVAGPTFRDLPRAGGLARLHGAVLGRRWRVELGAAFAGAPTRTTAGARVSMQRVVADVRGCGVLDPLPWLELAGCGGIEAGVVFAGIDGIAAPEPRRDRWVGVVVAPRVGFVLRRRVAFVVGGDLGVPLLRRDYTVAGLGRVHRTGAVTGSAVAGLEVRFP